MRNYVRSPRSGLSDDTRRNSAMVAAPTSSDDTPFVYDRSGLGIETERAQRRVWRSRYGVERMRSVKRRKGHKRAPDALAPLSGDERGRFVPAGCT